jgi:TonB family protein
MKCSHGASSTRRMLFVVMSILVTAHRLPAPILLALLLFGMAPRLPAPVIEEEEKAQAKPASAEPEKPKPKHRAKLKNEEGSASSTSPAATPKRSGSARNLTGPTPQYPPGASAQNLAGRGVYLLHFDTNTGTVTEVTITQSTGSGLLDQTCIAAFSQWHEDPNGPKEVPMTMTFKGPSSAGE